MPRISPKKPDAATAPEIQARCFQIRPRVWACLAILIALGFAGHFLWLRSSPGIAHEPQYVVVADRIQITPSPPWIRCDVKTQVLRDSGLADSLSVLDDWDQLTKRVKDAFELHPWIGSVDQITRRLPSSLVIDVKYRRPVAAVESSDTSGVIFLPIDDHAIRLPESDLTDAERRYLPRVSGITGRPRIGDSWEDQRVIGAAKLAAELADVWQRLHLVEILANTQSTVQDEKPQYLFEIVTTGNTRIIWGAPPGQESFVGDSPFQQKRQRLLDYATQHGKLESIDGPAVLDVRSDLVITPRTARKNSPETKNTKTQTK